MDDSFCEVHFHRPDQIEPGFCNYLSVNGIFRQDSEIIGRMSTGEGSYLAGGSQDIAKWVDGYLGALLVKDLAGESDG